MPKNAGLRTAAAGAFRRNWCIRFQGIKPATDLTRKRATKRPQLPQGTLRFQASAGAGPVKN